MNVLKKLSFSLLALLPVSLFSGTIYFNNGAVLEGEISEQNAQRVTIVINGKKTTYAMKDVKRVENEQFSPPPPPPMKIDAQHTDVIPAGTVLHLVTLQSVATRTHPQGSQFKMALESDLYVGEKLVAKKGTVVYAVVISSQQAGRLVGRSNLVVTLKALDIGGRRIPIQTQSLNVLTQHGQGRDSIGKTARGAVIGALVDGKDGAQTGAKIGLGAAVLTRGQAAGIRAGTLLDFALTADAKL